MSGNIFCVGRNYKAHAIELGNDIPKSPMIFTKPSHALVPMLGNEIELPKDKGAIHYEVEIVVRISKDYVPGTPIKNAIDAITLGIDFTLRDVQDELKKKGHPWLAAKGFKQSAAIAKWMKWPEHYASYEKTPFALSINDKTVQKSDASYMIFNLETIISHIEANYGLGAGDLIFTGTPEGVGEINIGDQMKVFWNNVEVGSAVIR